MALDVAEEISVFIKILNHRYDGHDSGRPQQNVCNRADFRNAVVALPEELAGLVETYLPDELRRGFSGRRRYAKVQVRAAHQQ